MSQVSTPLASLFVKTIQAAPLEGLSLLLGMVEEGQISLDTPVSGKMGLFDALINRALHETPAATRTTSNLFKGLFSPDLVDRWLAVSNGTAFARKDAAGRWLPMAFLDAVDHASENQERRARTGKPPREAPHIPAKAQLDKWLSAVLPSLPVQAWEEIGVQLMAKALELDLMRSASLAWQFVSPLSLIDGKPVLYRAHRSETWNRFVSEGGNTSHPVDGKPLWRDLLDELSLDRPDPEDSFKGGFERWLLLRAPQDAAVRQALRPLILARANKPGKTPPAQWLELCAAAGAESLDWPVHKAHLALWETIALSAHGQEFFQCLVQYPNLSSAIDPDKLASTHVLTLVRDICLDNATKSEEAFKRLQALVSEQGWPQCGTPWVRTFCRLTLAPTSRKKLLGLALASPQAWWGPAEGVPALSRELFFLLPQLLEPSKSKSRQPPFSGVPRDRKSQERQKVKSWEVLTEGGKDPWILVGRGLAGALFNEMGALHGVPREAVATVARDPHGMFVLESWVKSVATVHQKSYRSWLESAQMEALAPASPPARGSFRL